MLLTTARLSRGGSAEPGWEAPQGKHLLDTSACPPVVLLLLLLLLLFLSDPFYLLFSVCLSDSVISQISFIYLKKRERTT